MKRGGQTMMDTKREMQDARSEIFVDYDYTSSLQEVFELFQVHVSIL